MKYSLQNKLSLQLGSFFNYFPFQDFCQHKKYALMKSLACCSPKYEMLIARFYEKINLQIKIPRK